jgi:HAD superfamily hydrolase (TIGR01509 family)
MINTIIFDMDGVIVDSELHWRGLEEPFLRNLIPNSYNEYHKHIVGRSLSDIYLYLDANFDISMDKDEFMDSYNKMAVVIYEETANLLPGVLDFIKLLKKERFTLGLASSSPMFWVNMAVKRFDLIQYFKKIISADETGSKGKPAPDIYLHALKKLKKEPSECLAIEDSKNGVISAQEAGMKCVGLKNGFNDDQDLSRSDLLIHSFGELSLNMIKGL